jgi:predicted PurR-regulated permease PerM
MSDRPAPDAAAENAAPPTPGRPVTYIRIEQRRLRQAVILTLVLFGGFLVARWAFNALGNFLLLVLLSWLFAIAMEPAVVALARRGWRRGAATGVVMLAFVVGGAAFLALFGSLLFSQASEFITNLPALVEDTVAQVNEWFNLELDPDTILDQLNLDASNLTEIATNVAGGVVGILGSIATLLFDLLTILFFAFYISADSPQVRRAIGGWLPPDQQRSFVAVWEIAVLKTGGFVVSKVVLSTLSAAFHALFFYFIDLPFWLPLGIFTGLVSQLIPTVGTYIGVLLPALVALAQSPLDALWVVLFATAYQQVENYVWTPHVSRRTMDLHPALALASVFVGAALLGPIGALIGIPLMAAAITVIQTYTHRYELVPELAAREAGEKPERRTASGAATADPLEGAVADPPAPAEPRFE